MNKIRRIKDDLPCIKEPESSTFSKNTLTSFCAHDIIYVANVFTKGCDLMKKLYTVIVMAAMLILMPLNAAAALHFDPARGEISCKNAPEGTVYLDILVAMPADDENYTAFNGQIPYFSNDEETTGGEELDIDGNSEIAKYSEDGYVSLSLHHKRAKAYQVKTDGSPSLLVMDSNESNSCDFIDLYHAYGDYKAAYVDAEGHVLGVTGISERKFSRSTPYGFSADGSALIYHQHGAHPVVIGITVAVMAVLLMSLPVTFMIISSKRKRGK